MNNEENILSLLQEIRTDQLRSMQMATESIERQKKAIARQKTAILLGIPLIIICLVIMLWGILGGMAHH